MNISHYIQPKLPFVKATSYLQSFRTGVLTHITRPLHPAVSAGSTYTTRRTSTTPIITMAPRKTKPATVDSESSTLSSTMDSAATPHAHNLRRSGRNLLHAPNEKDRDHERRSEVFGRMLGTDETGKGLKSDKDQEEGVKMAIEGLARMERRLQRATKRQKKQLEEDGIPVPSAVSRPNAPYHPRPIHGEDAKRDVKEPMLKFHLNDSEREADTGADGIVKMETAATNIIDPDDSQDAPERGAARAPPVNSGYLPLPWKGRLGYVSTSSRNPSVTSNRV